MVGSRYENGHGGVLTLKTNRDAATLDGRE